MATATAPFSSEKEGFTGGYYKKQTYVDSAENRLKTYKDTF